MNAKERIEKLKQIQQADDLMPAGGTLTDAQLEVAVRFLQAMGKHDGHQKQQIGPCVYCTDCNVRLYQGKL